MKFNIITIFPKIFDSYFSESILGRAQKENLIQIAIHNLRDYSLDKHKKVDDTPYGGGAGMVMQIEPIFNCVKKIREEGDENSRVILFSAKGKKFTQEDAKRLATYENLVLICGRYEGIDERVAENIADEEISIGEYVLTGGEIPAMVCVDSVARLLPGVLGNPDSLKEESFEKEDNLEYPQYTRPEKFLDWEVPKVLLSGNHEEIEKWRKEKSKEKKV